MRKKVMISGVATVGIGMTLLAPAAADARPVRCGSVLVAKADWLGGQGIPVRSNGSGGSSCDGFSVRNRAVQYGGGWQCVEVAARLYFVRKWGTVFAGGNGGARYIPEGSPGLEFHANGSGYLPVPGDLVIEAHGYYGHVTVVDRVEAGTIHAVEQNASRSGRKTYELEGSAAHGAYRDGFVRGFMHSPRNTISGSPGTGPVVFAPGRPAVVLEPESRADGATGLRWETPENHGARVRAYEIGKRRWIPGKGRWSRWTSTRVSAETSSQVLPAGHRPTQFRIRAANSVGWGTWASVDVPHS